MEGNEKVLLDPDVIEMERDNKVPLSELYGLPVFEEDTEKKAGELINEEKRVLKELKVQIFAADGHREEENLKKIRSQLFQEMEGLTRAAKTERAEPVREAAPSVEMIAAGIMVLILVFLKETSRQIRRRNLYCYPQKDSKKRGI